jgi:hypothetical protein
MRFASGGRYFSGSRAQSVSAKTSRWLINRRAFCSVACAGCYVLLQCTATRAQRKNAVINLLRQIIVPQKVEEAARSIGKSERGKCELPQ